MQTQDSEHLEGYRKLVELIEKGYVFRESVKYKGNTAYFYFISLDGKDKKNEKLEFDDKEEIKEKVAELTELMKKKHGVAFYTPGEETQDKKENNSKLTKSSVKINQTMNRYDKNFATQIELLAQKEEWLVQVITQLGTQALFMVLQSADIPAAEWYTRLRVYSRNPDAFLDFAENYLVALFEAKEDAKRLMELQEDLEITKAEVKLWKIKYAKVMKLLKDRDEDMHAVLGMLNRKQMEKFMLYLALKSAAGVYESPNKKNETQEIKSG